MEINFSSNGFGNIGMGRKSYELKTPGAAQSAPDESKVSRPSPLQISRQVSSIALDGLAASEPAGAISDASLSRDDDLGRLISSAFNLPPPPMPDFASA